MRKVRNVTKTTVQCVHTLYNTVHVQLFSVAYTVLYSAGIFDYITFREENEELQSDAKWYKVVQSGTCQCNHWTACG